MCDWLKIALNNDLVSIEGSKAITIKGREYYYNIYTKKQINTVNHNCL